MSNRCLYIYIWLIVFSLISSFSLNEIAFSIKKKLRTFFYALSETVFFSYEIFLYFSPYNSCHKNLCIAFECMNGVSLDACSWSDNIRSENAI